MVLYETIETTEAKAKELKSFIDHVIARAKKGGLNEIKYLHTIFFDKNAVKKTIEELVPRYKDRNCGFTRSYHLSNRLGDNAEMMRLELIDKKVFTSAKAKPVKEEVAAEKETSKPEVIEKPVKKAKEKKNETK